jgi:hypothetical protein
MAAQATAEVTCIGCSAVQEAPRKPIPHEPWCPVITGFTDQEEED